MGSGFQGGTPIDFFQLASQGSFPNYSPQRKFGYNGSISTSETFIADIGGSTPYLPTTASTIEVISTNTNDSSNGTGIQQITVLGLDQDWNEVTEVLITNGTSASTASITQFIRVWRCYGSRVGTYAGSNLGALTVRVSGGGTSWLTIPIGQGQTKHCAYTVPLNKTLYLYDVHLEPEAAKSVSFNLWMIQSANDIVSPYSGVKRILNKYPYINSPVDFDYKNAPLIITQCSDVWITGTASTGTSSASAEITYVLKDN